MLCTGSSVGAVSGLGGGVSGASGLASNPNLTCDTSRPCASATCLNMLDGSGTMTSMVQPNDVPCLSHSCTHGDGTDSMLPCMSSLAQR